jgi:hypothetical protein
LFEFLDGIFRRHWFGRHGGRRNGASVRPPVIACAPADRLHCIILSTLFDNG